MDIVNTEMIIMSLLGIGFEKIDSIFLSLITGKIVLDYEQNGFTFQDMKPSSLFTQNIKHDGTCFKIRDKIFMFKNFSKEYSKENLNVRLRNQNRRLTEYLKSIDYVGIILKKIELLNIIDYNEKIELFSNKEIEIINDYYKENDNNSKKKLVKK